MLADPLGLHPFEKAEISTADERRFTQIKAMRVAFLLFICVYLRSSAVVLCGVKKDRNVLPICYRYFLFAISSYGAFHR